MDSNRLKFLRVTRSILMESPSFAGAWVLASTLIPQGKAHLRRSMRLDQGPPVGCEFRAGWPQGIAPLGLPQIRTCPFRHTAPHIMNALRDGTLSGSQPVVGADTVPASGRIDPREWSPYGVAGRAISSRYRSQTIGIGTEQ